MFICVHWRSCLPARLCRSRLFSTIMTPSFRREDSDLIHQLNKLSTKQPKLVKRSDFVVPAAPEITIRSWKMDEFRYYEIPSPFPTLARGLFSTGLKEDGHKCTRDNERYRIVIRGYDKFFNIGEVPWTTWNSLEEYTSAPYTLSLKSNGCIIFIAALTPSELLVTSKHSLGPVGNSPESHAEAGERWLKKHLQKVEKTTEELAAALWETNWTAVAELCDDEFEEHVLPYPPDKTGLHLHGLNETTGDFKTQPAEVVDQFATDWGFIVTKTITLNSIPDVRSFTEQVSQTGEWEGEPVEGFVVRTRVISSSSGGKNTSPPYTPGSTVFFKVKFDEPYMMYRDWREVTKTLLSVKGPLSEAKLPASKMKRPETKVYVNWVKDEIQRDRAQFATYSKGKGIIATRERFLEWLKTNKGRADEQGVPHTPKFGKTIIFPVAIPGVGKTTIAVALAHLFEFGHTQSDDIHAKKPAPLFIKNVLGLLKDHDVVIADKNNHLRQHRKSLRDAVAKMEPPVRLLALHWVFGQPLATIHRICGDRISARGENHQTLRANTQKSHEDVVWRFIDGMEELTENELDASIEMDIGESMEQALDRAIDGCVRILGLPKPDQQKVDEALELAREYQPKKKKAEGKKDNSEPRYFAFLAEADIEKILTPAFSNSDAPESGRKFLEALSLHDRVTTKPHITIVHSKSLPASQSLWDLCTNLWLIAKPPQFEFRLGSVVWNDCVMAISIEDIAVCEDGPNQEGAEFVNHIQDIANCLHITVGTRNKDIPPYEARSLIQFWKQDGTKGDEETLALPNIYVKGRIHGLQH